MSDRILIDSRTTAELVGFRSTKTFLRRADDLSAQHGFPRPLPTSRRPFLWRRDQVLSWLGWHGQAGQDAAATHRRALAPQVISDMADRARVA